MTNPLPSYDLSGRVALVTGAGSGIGRASAQMLAAVGARVWCVDINADQAALTASTIAADGGRASSARVDVTSSADVDAIAAAVVADAGRLDVWVNVAGIISNAEVLDVTESELDRVFAVNLKGTLFGVQAAGRVMRAAGRGSIVNFASAAIDTPAPTIAIYAMTKAAVTMLTKTLASEIGPSGVRVNAIAPGFTHSNMTNRHYLNADGTEDPERKAAVTEAMSGTAALRRTAQPDDIAHSVVFLASDASSFMTGQILRPNGGAAMPW